MITFRPFALSRRALRTALLCAACCLLIGGVAYAAGEGEPESIPEASYLPKDFGLIEQTIAVPFKPVSVYALVEQKTGDIRQYHGIAVPSGAGGMEVEAGQTVNVAALIPVPKQAAPDDVFHFTFFLASVSGDFAATEIRSWTWKALRENSLTIDSLEAQTSAIERDIPAQREQNTKLEAKLTQLREQASKIAGVDDLIDLKTELASLKGFDEKKSSELERLKELVKRGRFDPEPEGMDDLRMDLLGQLRNAARLTADADRLGMSQRESAVAAYRRKIDIVKQAEGVDPQELAQRVLELRSHRRELESRLNVGGTPEPDGRDF